MPKLDILSGTSKPVSILDFGGLPKTQKLLFQRFAREKTFLKIRTEDLPKVISRDLEFNLGKLQSFKLGKVDVGTRPSTFDLLPIKQLGKRTTRFETLSQFTKTKETDQFHCPVPSIC